MSKSPLLRLFLFLLLLGIPAAPATFAQETEGRPGAPVITSFSPVRGAPGQLVTVVGQNLSGVRNVFFGGSVAVFSELPGGTLLRAWVPQGAGSGPITVTTAAGSATSAQIFLVVGGGLPAGPTITSFTPGSGNVGALVTIYGQNLANVQNVFFGGQVASFQEFAGGTMLRATVLNGSTTGPITVVTAGGTAVSAQSFVVTGGSGGGGGPVGPSISSFTPASGPIFTQIRIFGSGFNATTQVRINNVPNSASYSVVSDGEISATVQPVATSGPISVFTTNGTAVSSGSFTVQPSAQPPSISFFSPDSGGLYTPVTIYGQNLSVVQNVFFNGQVAAFQEVAGGTQLRTWVPPGATTGPIRVVAAGGVATSAQIFFVP